MNEEELKKGCGKYFESDLEDYMEDKIIGYECNENHLCPTCQARLGGFQKGKLEQKKEELRFLENLWKIKGRLPIEIFDRIEQLQKEIKVSGDSLTEFWDNPEDDRWDKEEEKQDE